MPEPNTLVRTSSPAVGPAVCSHPGCTEPATHTYVWDWGETGACCARHMVELGQLSKTLKRGCQFAATTPGAPAPIQRTERVRLQSEILVREAELQEAKERGLQLYQQNALLVSQLQLVIVQKRELESQANDAIESMSETARQRDEAKVELADAVDELGRLRVIVDAAPPVNALEQVRRDALELRAQLEHEKEQHWQARNDANELSAQLDAARRELARLAETAPE